MNQIEAKELLVEVLKIKTVNGNEEVLATYLQRILEAEGFECEQVPYQPGRTSLIVTYDSGQPGKTLAFSEHLDVVPVGELEWEFDPFNPIEKDGKLYGRGSSDMKSGVAAMVVALIRLKQTGQLKKGRVKLLLTADEEDGVKGARDLTAKGYADHLDAIVIGEPTDLKVAPANKGVIWPTFRFEGKTAHGSRPHEGINAIEQALLFIQAFKDELGPRLQSYTDDLVGQSSYSINAIHGGQAVNVVPDALELKIDIRTTADMDHLAIKQDLQALLDRLAATHPNFKGRFEVQSELLAVRTDPSHPFVQLVIDQVKTYRSADQVLMGLSGGTDASAFTVADPDMPIVICGPGAIGQAHQPDEFVYVDTYLQAIDLYQDIAVEYLNT